MSQFTLDDLRRILKSAAGDDGATLDGDVLDTEFADLGYDSLALLELAGHVQREYGVPMPDDAPQHMTTPRAALDYVNARFAEVGA
ncbi:MAG TPA: acyl carrier protein [Pseudonocardiaceae bacterium]|mgnify:CR=1 FL=1